MEIFSKNPDITSERKRKMKNNRKKYVISAFSILLGLFAAVIISGAKFESDCKGIKDSVLRLHVIAASDSREDQELKLKVRDRILTAGSELFSGSVTTNQAAEILESEQAYLSAVAEEVCRAEGKNYSVKVETCKDRFPTKTYENVTLPAGEYTAVKVIIGEGKGHNWWCVMFPPMCLPAAESETEIGDVLNGNEMKIVTANPKYEVRFKIVEWYESLKEKWEQRHG